MKLLLIIMLLVPMELTTRGYTTFKPSTINGICAMYRMDSLKIRRQIQKESSWRPKVIGRHGEVGLMQLKPSTASEMWGRLVHPTELTDSLLNVESGILYLLHLRMFFKGLGYNHKPLDHLTWAAYNEGPGSTINRHFETRMAKRVSRWYYLYHTQQTLPFRIPMAELPDVRSTSYSRAIVH